jgi:hypothetical protein
MSFDQYNPTTLEGFHTVIADLSDDMKVEIEDGVGITANTVRGGAGCLNRLSASISGSSAVVRLPSGGAAG